MTGLSHMRPAAGWLSRRLAELADDLGGLITPRPDGVPPRRLRARVGAPGVQEYLSGGRSAAEVLAAALTPQQLADCETLLDFGCGPGRVLNHMAALAPQARCVGVDVDEAAVRWAGAHLARVSTLASPALPPLPFPDDGFSLIYSVSVFSHLDPGDQDAWLGELDRVLKPGGRALLSTHGPSAFDAFRSGAVRTAWCDPRAFARGPLGATEIVAIPYRAGPWSAGDLPGVGEGYGLTFHGGDYIREHWGRFLTVEAIVPRAISGWQDLVIARARSGTPV